MLNEFTGYQSRKEIGSALEQSSRRKLYFAAPLILVVHYAAVSYLSSLIGTQAALLGIFSISLFTWFTGYVPGIIFAVASGAISLWILGLNGSQPAEIMRSTLGTSSYLIVSLVSAFISRMHYSLKDTKKQLEEEHDKAQLLLSNILPDSIAERLKNGESLIADRYIESTILFCDLVGFTRFSRHHSPEVMVRVLDELITSFDNLSGSFGLEKIKTIGDAYLVVCGLPEKREDHAVAIARMALAMGRVVREYNSREELDLNVRIGIHSGPVIGGVIGKKKFTFDIWGDTVNVASRMESHGIPGEIQVSRETYLLLKDSFEFEKRGIIEVKNIGEIQTWILKGEIQK